MCTEKWDKNTQFVHPVECTVFILRIYAWQRPIYKNLVEPTVCEAIENSR